MSDSAKNEDSVKVHVVREDSVDYISKCSDGNEYTIYGDEDRCGSCGGLLDWSKVV